MNSNSPNKREESTKRAIAMADEYMSAPYPTYAEMGVKYGLSRQRIAQLVKRGEQRRGQ